MCSSRAVTSPLAKSFPLFNITSTSSNAQRERGIQRADFILMRLNLKQLFSMHITCAYSAYMHITHAYSQKKITYACLALDDKVAMPFPDLTSWDVSASGIPSSDS
jgi:hypothetical protein